MTVRRYTDREIADAWTEYRMAIKGFSVPDTLEFVDAAHYDALAAELAEWKRGSATVNERLLARVAALEEALLKIIELSQGVVNDPYQDRMLKVADVYPIIYAAFNGETTGNLDR
jgi:hypothetical protein